MRITVATAAVILKRAVAITVGAIAKAVLKAKYNQDKVISHCNGSIELPIILWQTKLLRKGVF